MRRCVRYGVAALGLVMGFAISTGAWAQTPWATPDAEKGKKNPVAAGKKAVEQGEKVAKVNCASCHGAKGKGDGAAAAALTPKPADWTSKKMQDETDGSLFWKISTGRGAMPPWKHLPETDRWALVHYLRSLKGK